MKKVFAVLFTILAVVGIAQIGGDRKRLSEQGPAQMNSQALCDCPFIPLAGTEVGSPVTGTIETDENGLIFAQQNSASGTQTNLVMGDGGGFTSDDGYHFTELSSAPTVCQMTATNITAGHNNNVLVNSEETLLISSNPSFEGVKYDVDYSLNYTDRSLPDVEYVKVWTGSGAPSTAPDHIGRDYLDITNLKKYTAFGLTVSDWVIMN